ncbi:MAG: carboxypeptidase regulatory-like domain-containing protein [Bacteroidales bacterium]|nr:carboxypeptidase regulatory-like domain-containing protein [Bacteroidales bacterium]MCF8390298.1 carboxypeptidase regulatory-like domain-containing protein [Bacteroidales bacterium]
MDSIRDILKNRGEVYLSLENEKYKSVYEASHLPGFDQILNDSPFLYLTNRDTLFIKQHLEEIRIHQAPSMLMEYKMASTREEVLQGIAYSSYPLYLEIMQYFADNWPEICRIDTIGYTINGRLLIAAHLAKDNDLKPDRPSFFYSSSIHGDETLGYSFMLMLINELLVNNQNPEISHLLENVNIYINPLENPDGTFYTSDSSVFGSTRNNAAGVDLNRNYPNPVKGDHPDFNSWQPESIAMMDYLDKIRPNLSANFHGGAELLNYPWDSYFERHPDDDWLRMICSEYADSAMANRSGYMSEFPGGISNGWDWYPAYGTLQDYLTYYLQGREVTIELLNTKTVPEYLIKELWETNKTSLLNYMFQAEYGLHGQVSDSITGLPVKAKIEIPEHDNLKSYIYSDESSGFFVRYLKAGKYNIEVSADGYQVWTMTDFTINDYETQYADIKLKRLEDTIPVQKERVIIENLFEQNMDLKINNPSVQNLIFKIFDLNGRLYYSAEFRLNEGINTIQISPIIPKGFYILRLQFPDTEKSFKIFKY